MPKVAFLIWIPLVLFISHVSMGYGMNAQMDLLVANLHSDSIPELEEPPLEPDTLLVVDDTPPLVADTIVADTIVTDTIITDTIVADTIVSDTLTSDTIEKIVSPVDTLDIDLTPDTEEPETLETPVPVVPERETVSAIRKTITPYDAHTAYGVTWDSLMVKHDSIVIHRTFAARSFYGDHELGITELSYHRIQPSAPINEVISLWLLICLLVIGIANYYFPLKFRETLMAAWNGRFYSQLERDGGLMKDWVSFFLYLNYLLVLALFIYQGVKYFNLFDDFGYNSLIFFLTNLLLFLALFYLVKYVVLYFLAWVFKSYSPTESYFRNILVVNQFTGIVLLPLLIINTYNPSAFILYFAIILLILINLYKVLRGSFLGHQRLGFSAYYLILYLCAVEIAPLLLMIKILKVYLLG